jgi:hypothetical protein
MPRNVLADFVDRRRELALFQKMLNAEAAERIMLLLDRGEQGKSYFLLRLDHECDQCDPSIPVVLLDFDSRKSGLSGYLDVARKVRRDLGDELTPAICDCLDRIFRRGPTVNVQTGSGESDGVDFGRRGCYTEAEVSGISGRDRVDIHMGDVHAGGPRSDQEERYRAEMGRALLHDLANLMATYSRVVLLIDTFEHVSDKMWAWLERWLFDSLRRELPHVVLVVAGRPQCRDFFERPHRWSHLITTVEHFSPLSHEDVLLHYNRRGLTVPESEASLIEIARVSPARMAQIGDWLEQAEEGAG